MEHLGVEGLSALLILLPGFLCARVIQWLCVRPERTELDKIIESLIYSFVVYLVYVTISDGSLPVRILSEQAGSSTRYDVQLEPKALGELAVISVVLAFAVGGVVTNDLSGRIFRKLRITQRTTRSSVWSDAFHDRGGVLQVELGDGRRVMGWLRYYSDEPKDASLFLEKAVWVLDDSTVPIEGPGILITSKLGINWVEFLDRPPATHEPELFRRRLSEIETPALRVLREADVPKDSELYPHLRHTHLNFVGFQAEVVDRLMADGSKLHPSAIHQTIHQKPKFFLYLFLREKREGIDGCRPKTDTTREETSTLKCQMWLLRNYASSISFLPVNKLQLMDRSSGSIRIGRWIN